MSNSATAGLQALCDHPNQAWPQSPCGTACSPMRGPSPPDRPLAGAPFSVKGHPSGHPSSHPSSGISMHMRTLRSYAARASQHVYALRRFGVLRSCLLGALLLCTLMLFSVNHGALFEVHRNSRSLRGFGSTPATLPRAPDRTVCVGFQRTLWCSHLGCAPRPSFPPHQR